MQKLTDVAFCDEVAINEVAINSTELILPLALVFVHPLVAINMCCIIVIGSL